WVRLLAGMMRETGSDGKLMCPALVTPFESGHSRQTASPAASSATLINRRRPHLAAKKAAAKKTTAARKAKARNVPVTRRAPATRTTRKLTVVTEVPDRAMVIFAHPDDAEIGSGGVIARWAAVGWRGASGGCADGAAGSGA